MSRVTMTRVGLDLGVMSRVRAECLNSFAFLCAKSVQWGGSCSVVVNDKRIKERKKAAKK